jgi:Uma2 family endonuclease
MLTAEKKKKYTVEDYMLLEEGAPFQLINYDLIPSGSRNAIHQLIISRLGQTLLNFLDAADDSNFFACASLDVKFDNGNIFQPDLIYISGERKVHLVKNRIEGVPDMIIEILSLENAYYNLRPKIRTYEQHGVKEFIIIDPIAKNADVNVLQNGTYYMHQRAMKTELLHSVLLPGLCFNLSKLFR